LSRRQAAPPRRGGEGRFETTSKLYSTTRCGRLILLLVLYGRRPRRRVHRMTAAPGAHGRELEARSGDESWRGRKGSRRCSRCCCCTVVEQRFEVHSWRTTARRDEQQEEEEEEERETRRAKVEEGERRRGRCASESELGPVCSGVLPRICDELQNSVESSVGPCTRLQVPSEHVPQLAHPIAEQLAESHRSAVSN